MSVLEVRDLRKSFGGVRALNGVSLDIDADSIVGIVGPNGSGKTTLFNVVAGALRPSSGSVRWLGEDISGRPPHRIARRGLVRSFQQAMSFPALSVRENVTIAAEHGGGRREGARSVAELLAFVGLEGLATRSPGRCRSAICAAWDWRSRWRRGRSCCCSTSRPPASTTRRRRPSPAWWPAFRRAASAFA